MNHLLLIYSFQEWLLYVYCVCIYIDLFVIVYRFRIICYSWGEKMIDHFDILF